MTGEELRALEVPDAVVPRPVPGSQARASFAGIAGLVVLILILGVATWAASEWKGSLKIRRVIIEGNRTISATEILQSTKMSAGMPMYGVDLNKVRENIMQQIYIKSASVARELPNALHIHVEERRPVAAVSQEHRVFLDDAAFVLPEYPSNTVVDVPFITGFAETASMRPGKVALNPEVSRALELLRQAEEVGTELYHLISEIHLEPGGDIVLYSSDAGVTILLGKEVPRRKFALLKLFWDQAVSRQGAERLQLVDLRFEDQVIARWRDIQTGLTRTTAF